MSNRAGLLKAHRDGIGTAEWTSGLPVLRAPTLTLRELCRSDGAALARWLKCGDTWQFTDTLPESAAGFEPFIERTRQERRAGRSACFAIVPLGLRDAVGFILVRRLDHGFHAGRSDVALGEPFYGTGLLSAAVEVALDYAFRQIGFHRIEVRSLDAREGAVLQALGAVREGVLRGVWNARGEATDGTLWSILRDEWTAARRGVAYDCLPSSTVPVRVSDGRATADDGPACARPRWSSGLPVLGGDGLTLREVEDADAPHLLRTLNPQDIRALLDPPPLTEKQLRQYIGWAIRERELGRAACYAVVVDPGAGPAGLVLIRRADPKFRTVEWGSVISATRRGAGLYPEVTDLLLEYLFETVGISRLEAQTTRQNLAALGSLRAAGGTREAVLRRVAMVENQSVDQELWAILREDWRRARPRPDSPPS
jgi:RimJ/RimL family protein N-acetyltransferase